MRKSLAYQERWRTHNTDIVGNLHVLVLGHGEVVEVLVHIPYIQLQEGSPMATLRLLENHTILGITNIVNPGAISTRYMMTLKNGIMHIFTAHLTGGIAIFSKTNPVFIDVKELIAP